MKWRFENMPQCRFVDTNLLNQLINGQTLSFYGVTWVSSDNIWNNANVLSSSHYWVDVFCLNPGQWWSFIVFFLSSHRFLNFNYVSSKTLELRSAILTCNISIILPLWSVMEWPWHLFLSVCLSPDSSKSVANFRWLSRVRWGCSRYTQAFVTSTLFSELFLFAHINYSILICYHR